MLLCHVREAVARGSCGGGRVHYSPRVGPPLVFLHGMGTGTEAWKLQRKAFADRLVLTPELALDAEFTISGEARRLWKTLPSGEADLCGLSLGALIALRMALDRPERVQHLVICAGFASLPLRYRALQTVIGAAAGVFRKELRVVFREGNRFDVSSELVRLTMPVLVLVGERDHVNRGLAKTLAASLPSAELQVIPGAGHVANVEAPEAFTAALRSALASS